MYQNSFWDTVKGQQLADILIEYLPTVAKNERVAKNETVSKQTKQYTMVIRNSNTKAIDDELKSGAKMILVHSVGTDSLFVVLEKEI